MKPVLPLILLMLLTAPAVNIQPAQAQAETPTNDPALEALSLSPLDLNRAKNQARQFAERLNGGLQTYRAEPSMHGPSAESPYRVTEAGQLEFNFFGRAPGASNYTIETVIVVDPDTWELDMIYNGAIRPRDDSEG
ncbi:MAG: hypothetical protein R6U67_14025 [Sodalinema sp.]|uniref:hypothetical protein n=1 Tax=Sodalinema sp. TaxID=3080550 RepID=UPI0012071D81|nr:MAG: hypothetical protein EYR95_01300 [Phormidium sp. SL48-SHIP]